MSVLVGWYRYRRCNASEKTSYLCSFHNPCTYYAAPLWTKLLVD